MGFFNKRSDNKDEQRPPRNPSNLLTFRVLAVGYVLYLCYNIVKLYLAGGPDAPSLTTLLIGLVVLGGGAIFIGIISYREWKSGKAAYDQYMAELRAEAEAKRAAEEAEKEELLLEDADYSDEETE